MAQTTAKLNYLKIAPRKVRLIANTLKGLSIQEAEAQLLLRVQRSSQPLLKLLRSAVSNARNSKLDVSKLKVDSILVNPGPMLKRFLPRAQGRATPIHKKMSHVVLTLKEGDKVVNNRFVINPPSKKQHTHKKERVKPKAEEPQKEQKTANPGFFKRMFNRRAV
ncbi:MAG: large subunit ribosomal protein L22 [Parcubacteria group bacterium Gr01-1014_19]|nr:MAG: large subunit ribosomal protein L22 [Parcubacteria group bacterium Gr01-1014_19]